MTTFSKACVGLLSSHAELERSSFIMPAIKRVIITASIWHAQTGVIRCSEAFSPRERDRPHPNLPNTILHQSENRTVAVTTTQIRRYMYLFPPLLHGVLQGDKTREQWTLRL